MVKITFAEFRIFSSYIKEISGIHLDHTKTYLLETRLGGLVKEYGCANYKALYDKAREDTSKTLERRIIDAITTNETFFFRDKGPFELLQHKILPELIDARWSGKTDRVPIKIWSAAASTGQEIYSVCIVIKELMRNDQRYNFQILATDISDKALTRASYGRYNKFEIERGLDKRYLQKYFAADGNEWKVKDEIRAMVNFRKQNLFHPFRSLEKFDIIFCRNVAIYFTMEDRGRLFTKLASQLNDDGYLIIGATESLTGVSSLFVPKHHLRSIYYQKA